MYMNLRHEDILESYAKMLQEVWLSRATFTLVAEKTPCCQEKDGCTPMALPTKG